MSEGLGLADKDVRDKIISVLCVSDITKKIENITNLGRESNCPTCTRPLLDEYDSVILSLEQIVIDTKKEKITTANKSLELIKKDKEQKEQLYKDVVKEHIELAKSVNLIDSKKKDLLLQKEHFEKVENKGLKNKEELAKLEIYTYDSSIHEHYRDWETDRKSTRLNSSHITRSRMPSSA